ncbi:MAG: carboxypeptidase-like regulatory domain-containing protein, partial [Bacteroidales bacterium]|nr:carboxypeptidase-like regulatory domain-containing protein [Bacteroidales bacterium]
FYTPDSNQHDTLINYVAPNGRVTGDDIVWLRTTPQRDWTYFPTLTCHVGDTVRIELGSPYGNQPLFYRIDHAAKCYRRGMLVLDSSHTSTLVIPITKRMLDGCVVTLAAMREGRSFAIRYAINVLRPDLRLDIGIETFRDRMQPGEQEQWRLRVTSPLERGGQRPGYVIDTLPKGIESNLSLTMYDLALEEYGHLNYGFWPWWKEYQELQIMPPHIESERMSYTVKTPLLPLYPTVGQPRIGFALPEVANYHKQLIARFGVSITGTIIDIQTQEPLPFVNVVVKYGNGTVKGTTTDLDGNFVMKWLPAGEYTFIASSVGYLKLEHRITVPSNGVRVLNIAMSPTATKLEEVQILESKVHVIEIGAPESGARMSADDIAHMPGTSVESIVASVGGVGYTRGENGMVTMQGGVRKRTGVNVPKEAIAEIPPMFNFGSTATDMASSVRKSLSTLALFEPALRSDKEGYATVSFTLPDILTQWQLYGFAWTDQFQVGTLNRTIQAQKELMVQPLMPRFLRQGDTIEIRAKVSNLTDSVMEVQVGFEIENGELKGIENGELRMENYLGAATNSQLTIPPRTSSIASARIAVPADWHVADYKVYAYKTSTSGGHLSDGEQGQLPVLSNRERITTSHLIYVPGSVDGKEIVRTFDIALPSPAPGDSTTLAFTANPIQYAIEALPHFKRLLMPGNIYLANSIYVNNLTILLDTLSPKERQRMGSRVKSDLHRILGAQASGGGWSWMPGGREASRYVTESVLQRLATCPSLDNQNNYYHNQYLKAIGYLDKLLVDINKKMLIYSHPWFYDCLSLIYTRSFYFNIKPLDQCDSTTQEAYRFCYQLCRMHSLETKSLHTQGQLALLMLHMGDTAEAISLANRIKESAHTSDDQGMYWLSNVSGYGWYDRPIETAALLVDVFADVLHDWESVSRIQQWILASKRGTAWRTDMATAAALRALLRQPSSTTINQGTVTIKCNNQEIESGTLDVEKYTNASANSQLSTLNFQLVNSSPLPAWGAVFHSHDTPIDSIQYNGTGMKLRKTLSRVNADGSLTLLNPGDKLHVGDRVRVHIDIDCQQGFDNIVLRDQRAATFEPASTTSGWQWNDGLRYYVDVRDEWTDCYIDHLGPEHYYVEYDLWVRHSGTFANGICTLQSVYAPEFRANTDSQNILVP